MLTGGMADLEVLVGAEGRVLLQGAAVRDKRVRGEAEVRLKSQPTLRPRFLHARTPRRRGAPLRGPWRQIPHNRSRGQRRSRLVNCTLRRRWVCRGGRDWLV